MRMSNGMAKSVFDGVFQRFDHGRNDSSFFAARKSHASQKLSPGLSWVVFVPLSKIIVWRSEVFGRFKRYMFHEAEIVIIAQELLDNNDGLVRKADCRSPRSKLASRSHNAMSKE